MNDLELFFQNFGFTFTLSKILSYLAFPTLGFILWFFFRKKMKRKWLKYTLGVFSIAIPFAIFFVLHPIYEGDFSNDGKNLTVKSELDEVKGPKLVVISIPNCPFCQESVGRLIDLKNRYPKLKVEYKVCANDSIVGDAVMAYREFSEGKMNFTAAKNGKQLGEIAGMAFPTFVLIENGKKTIWSNDHFGVGALDQVYNAFY